MSERGATAAGYASRFDAPRSDDPARHSGCQQLLTPARLTSEIGRGADHFFEVTTALAGFFRRIQSFAQAEGAGLQLSHAHLFWPDIYVEHSAAFPGLV